MVAPLAFFGFVGVAVAKVFASVWFSSRATSPLSEDWRREFLDHSETGINKLEELSLSTPEWIAALRSDMELLRTHVADGWSDKAVFDAACRVSTYLGWKHTTTGLSGIMELAGTYANHHVVKPLEDGFDTLNRRTDEFFDSLIPKDEDKPPDQRPPQ